MFYKYIFFSILATGYFLHRSSWWILDAIPDGLWRQEDSKCVLEGSETWKGVERQGTKGILQGSNKMVEKFPFKRQCWWCEDIQPIG
jgi:hypothetical protein